MTADGIEAPELADTASASGANLLHPGPESWPRLHQPSDRYEALLMTERWLAKLRINGVHRQEIPWDSPLGPEPFPRQALVRSLSTFQLGESGDGRHLRKRAERQSHPSYAEAIDLFVAEEQEHARLLAVLLDRLGAPLKTSHWTDRIFVTVRHIAGLRSEVLILMAAELIALRYYALIGRYAYSPVLRAVASQILDDELGHVGFHCDHLAWGLGAWPMSLRRTVGRLWRWFLTIASVVVAWDHRKVIRATGQTMRGFVADCAICFDEAQSRIFAPTSP